MAIAFGAISAVSTAQNGFNSVAVSGSDTLGVVYVAGDTSADNITAVTWGGSSMTKITAVQTPGGDRWCSVWYIVNPSSAGAIAFTGGSFWRSFNFYYTGVHQTTPIDQTDTSTSSANAAISTDLVGVASNAWMVMCQKDDTGGRVYTPSSALVTTRLDNDAGGLGIADSAGTVSGTITGTMTQTASTSNHGGIGFSIIEPAAAATAKPSTFQMMGV